MQNKSWPYSLFTNALLYIHITMNRNYEVRGGGNDEQPGLLSFPEDDDDDRWF